VGAALLAAAGWWVLRAPAVEHEAQAPPPDIDIDPPLLRARREAAIALALMPDDPWSIAESMAPSAPASAPGKEACGIDGRPAFSESSDPAQEVAETRGPSAAYANAQARIDAALRASADPLDRAVADWLNVGGMRSESGSEESVVQQAAATTDPRLYALGYGLCHSNRTPAAGCAAVSLDRWIQVDPGNGMPWLTKLQQARSRGDGAGVRAAMSRLAAATRFDVHFASAAAAVASRATQDEADLAAVSDLAGTALAQGSLLPLPPFEPLIRLCRNQAGGDETLARQCVAVSDGMFAHADTLIAQSISGALLLQTTGDPSRRDFVRAERAVAAARWSPATGFSECHDMHDALSKMVRLGQVGEVEAMRERARQFVAP
jgi:hypothetical protein